MNISIDERILNEIKSNDIEIIFKKAWCKWTKIDFITDFDKTNLEFIKINNKNIYFNTDIKEKLNNSKIIKKDKSFLFISEKVKSRCACSSSFSFNRELIDKDKLNKLKLAFKK